MRTSLGVALLVACFVPTLASAAFDDVTLTTDTVISVGGYTLNISGSSATIQSIIVGASSFSVTLASGSSFAAASPTRNQLSSDVTSNVTDNTCTGAASSITLAYSGGGTITNVITPSATICSGSGASSGSSGGNGAPPSGPLSIGYRSGAPTTTPPASFVHTTSSRQTVTARFVFVRDLRLRMAHADVRELQKYLNTQGFLIAKTTAGSPGKETDYFGGLTRAALIKFQEAHALDILAPLGLAKGTGLFGPSTRTFVNSLSQ